MELVEMETAYHHHHEDDKMRVLYEASYRGCVSTLNSLIQQDSLILNKINSQTVFIETPLHISASLGHFEFTKALLYHKPKLALELDPFGSTALHVASGEGHVDIVKELLSAYDQACMVPDAEGRIPLHYGVIRGRAEVVRDLVRAKPESLKILHKGKTMFHLCVEFNQLEVLKVLMELDIILSSELLNLRDLDGGSTILHLGVMFKQVETVRYLLSIPEIREASNLENNMRFTVSDILERIPRDFKILEIQILLMKNGINSEKKEMGIPPQAVRPPKEKSWRNILMNMGKWFEHKGDYLEEMRGNLSLVATVISTMTFQVALNPPGSYIQQSISNPNNNATDPSYNSPTQIYKYTNSGYNGFGGSLDCLQFTDDKNQINHACPGEAMLASRVPGDFLTFMIFNTISFISSLAVTLLLVSGVPLKNKIVMWILSIGMCITLSSLAFTYFYALSLMTPDRIWPSTENLLDIGQSTWYGLLVLVGLYVIVHFVIWAAKKWMNITKHRM